MGDSGVTASALIIGLMSINSYNAQDAKIIYVEELFLLFFIPGLDMFRLFIQRIFNKQNPFESDNQHLHHLLIEKYKLSYCLIFYFFITFLPLIIYKNFDINTLYLILSYTLVYLIVINFFLKKIPQ